jgi:hypothetical protein
MTMPEFTAESSLYKTSGPYRVTAILKASDGAPKVSPQRVTGPGGPIGLPGQDCQGACWHMCMSFGGGLNCMDKCMRSCSGIPGGLTTIGGLA